MLKVVSSYQLFVSLPQSYIFFWDQHIMVTGWYFTISRYFIAMFQLLFCLNFRPQNLMKFYGIFFTLFYQDVLKKCIEKHDKFLKISSNYFLMFSFFFVDAFAKFVLLILHNVRSKHFFCLKLAAFSSNWALSLAAIALLKLNSFTSILNEFLTCYFCSSVMVTFERKKNKNNNIKKQNYNKCRRQWLCNAWSWIL